ncbi:MAG TPA: hypothetical protein PKL75_03265 [Treponemataceae bacterium]|nr:hypothetical protein [Treponemataceae bacterium]
MENGRRDFEDYVHEGMDSFLKVTAKAGDSIRSASDRAIERIDLSRVEKRLARLYGELGAIAYRRVGEGIAVDQSDPEVARLVEEIAKTSADIDARRTAGRSRGEKDGYGKKNENDY